MTQHPPFLTVKEVAERLGVSIRSVIRWMSDRELPYIQVDRLPLIEESSLTAFLAARTAAQSDAEKDNVAKPELGTKRICPNCGAEYYDLNGDPSDE